MKNKMKLILILIFSFFVCGMNVFANNNSSKQYYYNCGGTCKQLYNYEKKEKGSACNDTKYSTEAKCEASLSKTAKTGGISKYDDAKKCQENGNYYNNDSTKAAIGCYELNKANCDYFGLYWYNNQCNYYKNAFDVTFDNNYGKGLQCDSDFTLDSTTGVCKGIIMPGKTIKFPASSSPMYRDDQGQLLGWSKSYNCVNGEIIDYSSEYTVNSNAYFYACYRETVGGWRWAQKDAVVDGGTGVKCGSAIWIEYCNRTDSGDYCYYIEPGTTDTYRTVDRYKLASTEEGAKATCDESKSDVEEKNKWYWVNVDGDDYSCHDELYITTCTKNVCTYTKVRSSDDKIEKDVSGKTIDRNYLDDNESDSKKACSKNVVDDNDKKCPTNDSSLAHTGTGTYTYCYDKAKEKEINFDTSLEELYQCDTYNGYELEKRLTEIISEKCNNSICKRTYKLSCTRGSAAKPTLSVTSGMVQGDVGTITVKAISNGSKVTQYYYSNTYLAPTKTESTEWKSFSGDTFTITETPGVYYIWVKDEKGEVSNAVSGAVLDPNNSNTTVKNLQLYDSNGNIQSINRVTYKSGDVTSSKYALLSNDLSKDSKVLADGFNPFDMEYKLEVSGPTVSVYATLTSTDSSYVEGYEPRTVNLSYGVNTVLIKIRDKENKVRTYTILVTRTDDRTSDNTLSSIETSVGKIDFNANVTDYKVEIPSDTNSVSVKSTISSDKAKYVSGYEPGNVTIEGDTTVKLIKVLSETGSTRTYVVTFVKEGTDVISDKTLQISELRIPGVYVPFEEDVSNYSLSVDYQTDSININTLTAVEDSFVEISIKRKNDNEYKLTSDSGIGLDVGENFIEIKVTNSARKVAYYRLTIIRKEFGLDISNDVTLKDLKVLGYNIKFNPNKKEYTVRIKQEKSLVITAVPNSNRAEVFIRGNEELTGFSTVRVKVVAENGMFDTYSIDIKKDAFNKTIEIASIIAGCVIILFSSCIIILRKRNRARREYFEE